MLDKELVQKFNAIPQKGQNQDDFVSEELEKEGKDKITIDYYVSSVLPAMLRMKINVELSSFEGWAIYEKVKKVFDEVSKPEEPVEEEKKEETAKIEAVNDKAEKKVTVATGDYEIVAEPVSIGSEEDQIKDIKTFARCSWSRSIPFTQKEECIYRVERIGAEKDKHIVVWQDLPQIGNFTTIKEFTLELEKLVDKIFSGLKIIMGQTESFDDRFNWEHTVWAEVGYDLQKILPIINGPEKFTTMFDEKLFPKESNLLKKSKNYFSISDPYSRKLEVFANDYYNIPKMIQKTKDLLPLFRAFYEEYLSANDNTYYLKTLTDRYMEDFSIWFVDVPNSKDFDNIVMTSPVVRKYVITFMREEIIRRITVGQVNTIKNYVDVLKVLNTRLNTYNESGTTASALTSKNPEYFSRTALLAMILPKYTYIRFKPTNRHSFNMLDVTDCFMVHLLLPNWVLKKQTILDINNYIYVHIVSHIFGVKGVSYTEDFDSDEDHLLAHMNDIRPIQLRNAFMRFFGSDGDNGFSNSGKFHNIPVQAKFRKILGRKIRYILPYGDLSEDSETYLQLVNFNKLVSELNSVKWNRTFSDKGREVLAILNKISQRTPQITRLGFKITEFIRTISALPYCGMIDGQEYQTLKNQETPPVPNIPRTEIVLDAGFATSYAIFGTESEAPVSPMKFEDIFDGLYLRGYLNQVSERYTYAKNTLIAPNFYKLKSKMFKKQEWYDFAFDTSNEEYSVPSMISTILQGELKTKGYFGMGFSTHSMDPMKFKIRKKIKKIIKNNPVSFGYLPEVAICHVAHKHYNKQKVGVYVYGASSNTKPYYFTGPVQHSPKVYSYMDLFTSVRKNILHKEIAKYVGEQRPIILRIPFKYKLEKFFYNPKVKVDLPIEFEHNSVFLKFKPVTIYYDHKQDYDYANFHAPQIIEKPMVVPILRSKFNILPDQFPEDLLLSASTMIVRPTVNIRLFEKSDELFQVSVYKH